MTTLHAERPRLSRFAFGLVLAGALAASVAACSSGNASAGADGGGKDTPACPSPTYTHCSRDSDCCSGSCAIPTSSGKTSYCTVPCSSDGDCAPSGSFAGSYCDKLTGWCAA